jgi:LysM domain
LRPTQSKILGGLLSVSLLGMSGAAIGQSKAGKDKEKDAPAPSGLRTGPATVAPHWSKYKYPDSIPEGTSYHIVERGDTLWDLSRTYLKNPYLWPQVWDKNKYIADAHWIYPGDPIVFPQLSLVSDQAGKVGSGSGTGGAGDVGGEAGAGAEGSGLLGDEGAAGGGRSRGTATDLYPVTEESTLQCAGRILPSSEDQSLRILGSEEGMNKVAFADREILYLNRGSNAGVKVGDVYTVHRPLHKIQHPINGKILGTRVDTMGWVRVVLVSEKSATAIVEQACLEMLADDYLRPLEKVRVPLVARRTPPDRMTPPSGKATGYVVDSQGPALMTGTGNLVSIDLGSQDGIAPGNLMTVFRIIYPDVPTSRAVIGELAVLTVSERTALAQVTYSSDAIFIGDRIELR